MRCIVLQQVASLARARNECAAKLSALSAVEQAITARRAAIAGGVKRRRFGPPSNGSIPAGGGAGGAASSSVDAGWDVNTEQTDMDLDDRREETADARCDAMVELESDTRTQHLHDHGRGSSMWIWVHEFMHGHA